MIVELGVQVVKPPVNLLTGSSRYVVVLVWQLCFHRLPGAETRGVSAGLQLVSGPAL